ncbi:hypothetical protein TNCV_3648401 [Trichonephila clavipes]|nr:hypothetical protein TNCV_3648401 [Trichonephila clavipes]
MSIDDGSANFETQSSDDNRTGTPPSKLPHHANVTILSFDRFNGSTPYTWPRNFELLSGEESDTLVGTLTIHTSVLQQLEDFEPQQI